MGYMGYTDASHNVLFTLGRDRWLQDLAKSAAADIVGYQEAGDEDIRNVLKEFCANNDMELFYPKGNGNPIAYRKSEWTPVVVDGKPVRGLKITHLSAVAMGLDSKYDPARDFTWIGLRHRDDGRTVLRINAHPVAGATRDDPQDGPALSQWKNWAIQQYWLDLIAFTAREMSRPAGSKKSMARFWSAVTLGGDYNGDLLDQKGDQWYYPNRMLGSLYALDPFKAGLDHLQHAYGSDVKVLKRWAVEANTDHKIHFVSRQFATMDDTPGG